MDMLRAKPRMRPTSRSSAHHLRQEETSAQKHKNNTDDYNQRYYLLFGGWAGRLFFPHKTLHLSLLICVDRERLIHPQSV